MSLKTWKAEFYPVPAGELVEGTDEEAIEHSLRKWRGLREENLKKHDVELHIRLNRVIDKNTDEKVSITSFTCALCEKYFSTDLPDCANCPLYYLLGGPCDANKDSPYMIFTRTRNPEPMIEALEECKLLD